jgi:hypothetical protein
MSFLRRFRSQQPPDRAAAAPAEAAHAPAQLQSESGAELAEAGDVRCSEAACKYRAEAACAYMDRRRRGCETVWCREHVVVIEGQTYCRRHVGIVRALAKHRLSAVEPPDIDNRAPGLAEWVGNEVEAEVQGLLHEVKGSNQSWNLASDPLNLHLHGVPRTRAWERRWTLSDQTGVILSVIIRVEEEKDDEVLGVVGAEVVERITPPWIQNRSRRSPVPAEIDASQRKGFREALMRSLTAAAMRRKAQI